MTTTVTLEIAKLLKAKGYDIPSCRLYYKFEDDKPTDDFMLRSNINIGEGYSTYSGVIDKDNQLRYYAPDIAEVVMWLYEKRDVWISLIPDTYSGQRLLTRTFTAHLFTYRNGLNVQAETLKKGKDILYFNSPTEAYLSAITHALNNLL